MQRFILAVLAAATMSPMAEAVSRRRTYASRTTVNRLSVLSPREGDLRYATCKFHKPYELLYVVGHNSMNGIVYVEQKYTGGTWLVPWGFIYLDDMDRGTTYTDAQYTVTTYYGEDYDNIKCQAKAPADMLYPPREAVSGVTPVDGYLNINTLTSTLGSDFLFPDQVSADGVNAATNVPFNQVVQISL